MSLLIKSLTCQICTLNEINVFFFHASFTLKIGLNLGCCIHVFSKQDSFFIIFKWICAFRAKFIWFFTLPVIPIFFNSLYFETSIHEGIKGISEIPISSIFCLLGQSSRVNSCGGFFTFFFFGFLSLTFL